MTPAEIEVISEKLASKINALLTIEAFTVDTISVQLATLDSLSIILNQNPRLFICYKELNKDDLIKITYSVLITLGIQPDQLNLKEQTGEYVCFYRI